MFQISNKKPRQLPRKNDVKHLRKKKKNSHKKIKPKVDLRLSSWGIPWSKIFWDLAELTQFMCRIRNWIRAVLHYQTVLNSRIAKKTRIQNGKKNQWVLSSGRMYVFVLKLGSPKNCVDQNIGNNGEFWFYHAMYNVSGLEPIVCN